MNIDRIVLAFAGSMVLVALALGFFGFPTLSVILLAFIGLNMLQAPFTGVCPLAIILKKMGKPTGSAFN